MIEQQPTTVAMHGRVPSWGAHTEERSPICRAPFVAMEFDPFGDVQACCANALYPLGNVSDTGLQEIWRGERAQELRERLLAGDLSLGCSVCRYRLTYGHGDLARDYYDHFPVSDDGELWPFSLQFSLHNTCNLACVMCGADRSSRIRTQRAGLRALPQAYGERFFEEIVPFLAHAGAVDFSGGEPFLVTAHHRIWEILIDLDHRPLHSLTTNGTIWNDRVEGILGALDTHIAVSIDGMTKRTFESIRVGASFDEVFANLQRFLAYTQERGTILTLGWSLLQQNWHELGAAARFADERGIDLKVHTVIEPEFGVQRLPTRELERVVRSLEEEGEHLVPTLTRNRDMWLREVARLHEELAARTGPGRKAVCMEPPSARTITDAEASILEVRNRLLEPVHAEQVEVVAREDLERWGGSGRIGRVVLDPHGAIREIDLDGLLPVGIGPVRLDHVLTVADLLRAFERDLAGILWIVEEFDEGDRGTYTYWVGREVRDKVGLALRCMTVAASDAIVLLISADDRFWPSDEETPEVSVSAVSVSANLGIGRRRPPTKPPAVDRVAARSRWRRWSRHVAGKVPWSAR